MTTSDKQNDIAWFVAGVCSNVAAIVIGLRMPNNWIGMLAITPFALIGGIAAGKLMFR